MSIKLNVIGSNQTEVVFTREKPDAVDVTLFFSYNTLVGVHSGRFYVTSQKYSSTTTRHVNAWLSGANAVIVSQDELEAIANRHREGR